MSVNRSGDGANILRTAIVWLETSVADDKQWTSIERQHSELWFFSLCSKAHSDLSFLFFPVPYCAIKFRIIQNQLVPFLNVAKLLASNAKTRRQF